MAKAAVSLRNRLLVATPVLGDPNFERTVILILEHGDEGAIGVVLNRPTGAGMAGPLAGWGELASEPPVLFRGGPVSPDSAVCLARVLPEAERPGWEPLVGAVGLLDLSADPSLFAPAVQALRVFVGYAGWTDGQVESEIEVGAWFVVDLLPDDPFSIAPGELWGSVLRRQGGPLAMYANYPTTPTSN